VSLTPERRFGARARVGAALALAAGFALATWGGAAWWKRGSTIRPGIEVVALRGNVLAIPGAKSTGLSVGEPTTLTPEGTLETSQNGGARIKASGGLEIDLLENTKVSLDQLDAVGVSPALRLERGRVRCVIKHQPGRTFSVVTSDVRVVDVGTTFSVSVDSAESKPRTFVHVEEGEVLVLDERE
jgi:ferric-dicitrate binding protein FerR (iron transport regulator)